VRHLPAQLQRGHVAMHHGHLQPARRGYRSRTSPPASRLAGPLLQGLSALQERATAVAAPGNWLHAQAAIITKHRLRQVHRCCWRACSAVLARLAGAAAMRVCTEATRVPGADLAGHAVGGGAGPRRPAQPLVRLHGHDLRGACLGRQQRQGPAAGAQVQHAGLLACGGRGGATGGAAVMVGSRGGRAPAVVWYGRRRGELPRLLTHARGSPE
jgi:hypothetical protein